MGQHETLISTAP